MGLLWKLSGTAQFFFLSPCGYVKTAFYVCLQVMMTRSLCQFLGLCEQFCSALVYSEGCGLRSHWAPLQQEQKPEIKVSPDFIQYALMCFHIAAWQPPVSRELWIQIHPSGSLFFHCARDQWWILVMVDGDLQLVWQYSHANPCHGAPGGQFLCWHCFLRQFGT